MATATRPAARKARVGQSKPARAAAAESYGGIGSAAVEKATGRGWAEWLKILDKDGAAGMSHKEIALHLHERRGVGDWWAQMVTVGYEQARGRREKHQKAGGYEVSVGRVIGAPMAAVFRAWSDAKTRAKWLPDEIEVRKATPGKSMRITWPDATSVSVNFYAKGAGKTQVSAQHGKLKNAKVAEKTKRMWAARLESLKGLLEG